MQMDVCTHIGFPVNDASSLHGFYMDTLESTYEFTGDFSVDELAYEATKYLNIQDNDERVSGSMPLPSHEKGEIQMKDECPEAHDVITAEVLTYDDNAKSVNLNCSSVPSLLNPLKPVSAMKGSREKRGVAPPKKLTVKWAPDVYDPVPSSELRMVINMPRKRDKKSKNKQKNGSKSSRGSKSKDKKQGRKRGGKSSDIIQPSVIDCNLGIPDLFCGGSFVNPYGSNLHLSSVAMTMDM